MPATQSTWGAFAARDVAKVLFYCGCAASGPVRLTGGVAGHGPTDCHGRRLVRPSVGRCEALEAEVDSRAELAKERGIRKERCPISCHEERDRNAQSS